MTIIVGIDPGSRYTGYGIIKESGQKIHCLDSGRIRVTGNTFPEKLALIYTQLKTILAGQLPDEMAIEDVFMGKNAASALKLGQARGAAIAAAASFEIPVHEYTAKQVKQAVVGNGNATKHQVQQMICHLLGLTKTPEEDAADALAIAICHGHTRHTQAKLDRLSAAANSQ